MSKINAIAFNYTNKESPFKDNKVKNLLNSTYKGTVKNLGEEKNLPPGFILKRYDVGYYALIHNLGKINYIWSSSVINNTGQLCVIKMDIQKVEFKIYDEDKVCDRDFEFSLSLSG